MSAGTGPPRGGLPDGPAPPWTRHLPWLALLPALLWIPWLRTNSHNLHSLEESTAGDRILLGLRTLWGEGPAWLAGVRQPMRWQPDPNFPLGTGLLFSIPHALGWEPESSTRNVAFAAAALAALVAGFLARRLWGGAAGLAGVALWGIPAFQRAAVVSGEEALALLLLLLGLMGLTGPRTSWAFLPSALALGATASFRLDLLPFAAGAAVLGGWTVGGGRGLLWAAGALLPGALHLAVSARVSGDALQFAHTARTQALAMSASPADWSVLALPQVLLAQLSLPVAFLVSIGSTSVRGGDARLFGALTLGLLVLDEVLVVTGAMQARFVRYSVPLLGLLVVAAAGSLSHPLQMLPALRRGAPFLLAAGILAFLVRGGWQATEVARTARYPDGLREAAAWLRLHPGATPVLTSGMHPELAVWSGLGGGALQPTGPVQDAARLRHDLDERGAGWLILLPGDDATRLAAHADLGCIPEQVYGSVRILRCRP